MTENVPAKTREGHLARRVTQLAKGMPGLEDLTPAQVDRIAQGVAVDKLKAEMRRAIAAERVDWQAEREAYGRALDNLGTWLESPCPAGREPHAAPGRRLHPGPPRDERARR